MNILGVGLPELILILIIMLIIAGPRRMIEWAYTLGKYSAKLRRIWAETMQLIQQEMHQAGVDVDLPQNIPTRQNINTWVNNTIQNNITTPIQKETAPIKAAINDSWQTNNNNLLRDNNTPSWLPSAHPPKIHKPQDNSTDNKPTHNVGANASAFNLGTWSNASPDADETSNNFGAWGQIPAVVEQPIDYQEQAKNGSNT